MPEIIHGPVPHSHSDKPIRLLHVDRLTLVKRRWRAAAEDGRDFGFDLEYPLHHRAIFFETDSVRYQLEQRAEPVLESSLATTTNPELWALLGWNIGNLHFPIEIEHDTLRVVDDPALRMLFERESISFVESVHVFHPSTLSAPHGHH